MTKAELAPWHPGRCAALRVGDWVVGHAGELHPKVVEALGLPPRTCAMELDLDAIPIDDARPAPQVSPYPPISVDVALVAAAEVPVAELADALLDGGGALLEELRLFDVYTGEQVGDGPALAGFRAALPGPGPHADQRGGQRRPGRRGGGGRQRTARGCAPDDRYRCAASAAIVDPPRTVGGAAHGPLDRRRSVAPTDRWSTTVTAARRESGATRSPCPTASHADSSPISVTQRCVDQGGPAGGSGTAATFCAGARPGGLTDGQTESR